MDAEKQTDGKLTYRDVYETLWKCRDIEIATLWQRSIMLGAFMVTTYAGYGALMLKALDFGLAARWTRLHLLAVGMCCFGMVFSALWVMMLKGSKGWCEVCEAALNAFRNERTEAFMNDEVRKDSAFAVFNSEATTREWERFAGADDGLFSARGGRYSVSRVAIAVGQVSLGGWILLAVCHVMALAVKPSGAASISGKCVSPSDLYRYATPAAAFLFAVCAVLVFRVLKDHVKSSSL